MSSTKSIIVKKVKKGGHAGHHGGAWKVAYADFVTAMMAFFLLLWLLSMVSDEKKARVSEYFKNYSMFDNAGQSMMDKSDSMFSESGLTKEQSFQQRNPKALSNADDIEEILKKGVADNLEDVKDQILIDVGEEGVRIQITDNEGSLMFEKGKKELTSKAKEILSIITANIKDLPNKVMVEGHTDALKYSGNGYSNWELSTERASSARKELEGFGLDAGRITRVAGYADTDPLIREDPLDARNRRISITIKHAIKTDITSDNDNADSAGKTKKDYKSVADNIKESVESNRGEEIDVSLSNNFKYRGFPSEESSKSDTSSTTALDDDWKTKMINEKYFPLLEGNKDLDHPIEELQPNNKKSALKADSHNRIPSRIEHDIKAEKAPSTPGVSFEYVKENEVKERPKTGNVSKESSPSLTIKDDLNPAQMQKTGSANRAAKNRVSKKNPDEGNSHSIKSNGKQSSKKPVSSLSGHFDYNEKSGTTDVPETSDPGTGEKWNPVISNDDFLPVQTDKIE